MPKKLSVNSKSVEARERKQQAKKAALERAVQEAEDLKWQDNDKNLARKQQKKEEEERKKAAAARRKAENRAMLDEEMSSLHSNKGKQAAIPKVTRHQVQEVLERRQRVIEGVDGNAKKPTADRVVDAPTIQENLNRFLTEEAIARNVDEALAALNGFRAREVYDSHPEKRMREAYRKFEDLNLPRIRAENPTLRMSQWKQLLMKEWSKSPLNPFNN